MLILLTIPVTLQGVVYIRTTLKWLEMIWYYYEISMKLQNGNKNGVKNQKIYSNTMVVKEMVSYVFKTAEYVFMSREDERQKKKDDIKMRLEKHRRLVAKEADKKDQLKMESLGFLRGVKCKKYMSPEHQLILIADEVCKRLKEECSSVDIEGVRKLILNDKKKSPCKAFQLSHLEHLFEYLEVTLSFFPEETHVYTLDDVLFLQACKIDLVYKDSKVKVLYFEHDILL